MPLFTEIVKLRFKYFLIESKNLMSFIPYYQSQYLNNQPNFPHHYQYLKYVNVYQVILKVCPTFSD